MKTLSFDDYLKKRLSAEEIQNLEFSADVEAQLFLDLQSQISSVIKVYMESSELGFNDMVRLLGTSPSQFKKIQDGKANLTIASMAHIFALMKKRAKIILEDLPVTMPKNTFVGS